MDEGKLHQDIRRGQETRELMENSLLQEAFAAIEADIFKVWQTTKTNQQTEREDAWLTQRAMNLLKMKLEKWLMDGRIAAAEMEKLNAKKKKAKKEPQQ